MFLRRPPRNTGLLALCDGPSSARPAEAVYKTAVERSKTSPDDAAIRSALARALRPENGYRQPEPERAAMSAVGAGPVYGELGAAGTSQLLRELALTEADVVVDLGSGLGRFALHGALATPARFVGVELAESRHQAALRARARLVANGWARAAAVEFVCADLRTHSLEAATVVFACSTAFPPSLLRELAEQLWLAPRLRCFVAPRLPEARLPLPLDHWVRLDTTWDRRVPFAILRKTCHPEN